MANTITKRELVNKVCAELDNGYTQNEVLDIIQKTIELITDALVRVIALCCATSAPSP